MDIRGSLRLLNGGQLLNANIESGASDPIDNLYNGRLFFNTTSSELKVYKSGSPGAWIALTDANTTLVSSLDSLTDVVITGADNGDVLHFNGTNWVNNAPGALSGVQAHDATLDGIAALTPTTDQMIYATGADTFATTALTSFARSILDDADAATVRATIDAQQADATLTALAGLSGIGIVVETGTDTFTHRSIAGTAGNIDVANGDGTSANPTINLASVSQAASGDFVKVTLDGFGRVTGNTPVVSGDGSVFDSRFVNVDGDSMTAALAMGGNNITGVADPIADQDAATKLYVDTVAQGLHAAPAVLVATTADLSATYTQGPGSPEGGVGATLNLGPAASLTIDGVAITAQFTGILVKDQTNAFENGRYYVSQVGDGVTDWILTRCTHCDESTEIPSSFIFVQSGTLYGATGWAALVENPETFAVGVDDITWTQFSGAGSYTAGEGLYLNGTQFNVHLGAGIGSFPTGQVGVDVYDYTNGALGFHDGVGRVATEGAAVAGDELHLFLDGSTLSQSGSGLKVAAAGITSTELHSSVAGTGIGFSSGVLSFDGSELPAVTDVAQFIVLNGSNVSQRATPANVASALVNQLSIGDMSDVNNSISAVTSGHVVAATGSEFTNRKVMHVQSFTSQTSVTVPHNLNQSFVLVQVYENGTDMIIPESVVLNSTTQCTVTFNTAISGNIVVMGMQTS